MNASFVSAGSVPIGFRSFAEEEGALNKSALDQSFVAAEGQEQETVGAPPHQDISFAEDGDEEMKEGMSAEQSRLHQEIQNRASLDASNEDSLQGSNLPLTKGISEKRKAKLSAKKNELYLKILKENGLDPQAKANAYNLNYEIPPLTLDSKAQKNLRLKPKTPV